MASRERVLYTRDKIYRLIGDMMGAALQFGLFRGLFEAKGLKDLFLAAPKLRTTQELQDLFRFINDLAPDFSKPCQVNLEEGRLQNEGAA